jgi:hypothetical protein
MKDEINKVFKQVFKKFLKEDIRACASLVEKIDGCMTYKDLKDVLEYYAEEISDHLGHECVECVEKNGTICGLSQDLEEAQDQLMNKSYTPNTLNDVYMLESFMKNKDKFTVSEFEALMD